MTRRRSCFTGDLYILRGRVVVPEHDFAAWGQFMAHTDRHVALTELHRPGAALATVSTVFLGLDHAWGDGPMRIFETMVFGGPHAGAERRYATWEEAAEGHAQIVGQLVGAAYVVADA